MMLRVLFSKKPGFRDDGGKDEFVFVGPLKHLSETDTWPSISFPYLAAGNAGPPVGALPGELRGLRTGFLIEVGVIEGFIVSLLGAALVRSF